MTARWTDCAKESGSGRVRDCMCVRVSAQLSAWKVMDNELLAKV